MRIFWSDTTDPSAGLHIIKWKFLHIFYISLGDLVDNLVRLDHIFDLKEVIVKQQAQSCPDSPNCPVFMVKDNEETSVFEDTRINCLLKTLNEAIEKLKSSS